MPIDMTKIPDFAPQVALVRDLIEELRDDFRMFNDVVLVPDELDEIETQRRDGFIPFTNGGFEVVACASMGNAHGSGCVPDAIEPYLTRTLEDCRKTFIAHRGLPEDCSPWDPEDVGQDTAEEFWDYESEWLWEGGTYFYKARAIFYAPDNAHGSGEAEVYIMAAINTDFEYGRDSVPWLRAYGADPQMNKLGYAETIPLSEVTPEKMAEVLAKCRAALADC